VVKAGTVREPAFGVVGTSKMEKQVDGVHKATVTGNKIDVNLTLGTKGKRRFDFFSINSAGGTWRRKLCSSRCSRVLTDRRMAGNSGRLLFCY
jgi:hypothetical protein